MRTERARSMSVLLARSISHLQMKGARGPLGDHELEWMDAHPTMEQAHWLVMRVGALLGVAAVAGPVALRPGQLGVGEGDEVAAADLLGPLAGGPVVGRGLGAADDGLVLD